VADTLPEGAGVEGDTRAAAEGAADIRVAPAVPVVGGVDIRVVPAVLVADTKADPVVLVEVIKVGPEGLAAMV